MNRRRFIVGLGSAAAGSAAVLGSGAFSAAQLDGRDVNVKVVDDSDGLIGLVPNPNVAGIHDDEGELTIDLADDGQGLNQDSIYQFGYFDKELSPSDVPNGVTLGEFPYTQNNPASRNSDEFGSGFLVANQTSSQQNIELEYKLDTNPDNIETDFWFEAHNEGRCGVLREPTNNSETATTELSPGDAVGVSALFHVPDDTLGEKITGSLSVRAGNAVDDS